MTSLIENLQGLQRFTRHGIEFENGSFILADDLRAIIESAKSESKDPVAYIHRNEYNEYRLEPKENLAITDFPLNVDVDLFTHPPLSDETVKDAQRYAFLRDNCSYELSTGCWDIEFMEHGDTLDEAIDREIEEVTKAANG